MRIIHTSDWHLGQYFYGKSRANEHQQFLHWLLAQVKSHAVDAIIVAGDIFDTATPPSYARQMYFNFISELQAIDCQLIILAGNHDSVSMLAESKTLLSALSTKVIANVTDISNETNLAEQVFTLKNKAGIAQAVICAIPFIRPRDVIKSQAGQSATDKSKQLQQAIVEHYQDLFEHAQQLVSQNEQAEKGTKLPIIATGHLTALGVTTSDSVRDIYIGTLEAFPSNAFPAADYIALGHIHRAQKVGKTEHIRYSGSPIALSFDEAKQEKRVLLVDFKENKLSTVTELTVPCFQPLAMLKTTLDTLNNDLETLISTLLNDSDIKENEGSKLWLDIELANTGILSDLQPKITALVKDFPVEVLLVRRQKQVRTRLLLEKQQDQSTLSELTLDEVFDSRLQQEVWLDENNTDIATDNDSDSEILQRKEQLKRLFKETVTQVLSEGES
jgi:exonuclease SbcD